MSDRKIAVVGLGYVGLPVAVAFGIKGCVIGYDIDVHRIGQLRDGIDRTGEVTADELKRADVFYTTDPAELKRTDFIIVTVPTPIGNANRPILEPLKRASETVGRNLTRNSIVVYESTVYPGVTEDVCLPILERESGLKGGVDFKVGYSPERINPGDKERRFTTITKVVAGQDTESLEIIAETYGGVVTAGVHKVSSIKVAEAAKVIENTQRDLNIALMNELAVLFNKINIDTAEVLEAARTKWNFLNFKPGLVGGHCIGVDPYYLTHLAESVGYHPQVILAGRRINDNMGIHVAQESIKRLSRAGIPVHGAKVLILGATFKEDCPDLRNSRVLDIIDELRSFGCEVTVHDPLADPEAALREFGIELHRKIPEVKHDLVILAVAHASYREMKPEDLKKFTNGNSLVVDVKGIMDKSSLEKMNLTYWRL